MTTTIYIKNMVCVRCKMAVEAVLQAQGIAFNRIELGWADIEGELNSVQQAALHSALQHYQLELMQNKTAILIEKIKTEITRILADTAPMQLKLSAHLSEVLGYNYTHLANTFSETEGQTLERYYITQRVERVKELMVYEELSLGDITEMLHYSSVSHLCQQFKKVSGLTPAEFKKKWQAGRAVWRPI